MREPCCSLAPSRFTRKLFVTSWTPGIDSHICSHSNFALRSETVPVSVLPEYILHSTGVRIPREGGEALPADASLFEIMADFEARKITEVLDAVNHSQTDAAARLKIPLSTLNQKIKRLGIQVKRKPAGN